MPQLFALVILFGGSPDGGRAIDASLRYTTLERCEQAAALISGPKARSSSSGFFPPFALCVPVDAVPTNTVVR